ncbi:MAG: sialidase family protein [Thermoproteota archaeon]
MKTFTDHSFIRVSKDLRDWRWQQVKYEEGADFSEDDWAREGYVNVNEAYAGCNIEVLENGDIMFPVAANVVKCCRILGIDVNVVFPSCPQIMHGLIVFRGSWNKMEEKYDLTPSKPVVISDLKSSRGVDEPTIIVLKSRRIVVVFRGSNVISKNWKTRIRRGTPSHKWYVFSDDGGRTFSEPVPWHYDNGEIFYSPASISRFF